MANLGPSEKLLKHFLAGKTDWEEFSRLYRKELLEGGGVDRQNSLIKNHGQKFTLRRLQVLGRRSAITVLCHCAEDQLHCHRHLLRKILQGKI